MKRKGTSGLSNTKSTLLCPGAGLGKDLGGVWAADKEVADDDPRLHTCFFNTTEKV